MNNDRFFELSRKLQAQRESILGIKGTEYPTGGGDRLSNFKEIAEWLSPFETIGEYQDPQTGEWRAADVRVRITPDLVGAVYLGKHILSLMTFIREQRLDHPDREPISGRINDIQNYGDLLYAIFSEQGRVTDD